MRVRTIDVSQGVHRKYHIEENRLLATWFEFGVHPNGDVDIADVDGDVFTRVPKDKAVALLKARDEFLAKVEEILLG